MAAASHENVLVLVAVDGSEHCGRALDYYLKNLHRPEYTVGLIHSYENPSDFVIHVPSDIVRPNVDDIEKAFRGAWDNVDKIMDKYKKICGEHGVENVKEFVEHRKSTGEAICSVAEKENAAFIVVGSRGQSMLRRTFLGSVSMYVVKHSKKAAVLVVP